MDNYESLIQGEATRAKVNHEWVMAIVRRESSFNAYSIRFESSYAYLFQVEMYAKKLGVTINTEMMCQKTSWGLGQIMGALAREQGHQGPMGELFLPEVNIKHLCIRIKKLMTYSLVPDDVFACYNGGPGALHKKGGVYINQEYVNTVKSYLLLH